MEADPTLLRLPGETLDHALSYTLPDDECQTLSTWACSAEFAGDSGPLP